MPTPQPPQLPFGPHSLPFLSYIQDLARTNNINSPVSMAQFLENLQKELFSAVHSAGALEAKRIPRPPPPPGPPLPPSLPAFSQTVHHHHHPYFSQILFNNSFINHYPPPPLPSAPSLMRFNHLPSDRPFPFHVSTPKKRRTKVSLSPVCLRSPRIFLFVRSLIHACRRASPRKRRTRTIYSTTIEAHRTIRSNPRRPIINQCRRQRRPHRRPNTMLFK